MAAQQSGTLSAEQADPILAAAARVRSDLPPTPPVPSITPSQTDTGDEHGGAGKSEEHKNDHGNKHD